MLWRQIACDFAVYKRQLHFLAYKSRKRAVRTASNLRRSPLENALAAASWHKFLKFWTDSWS